MRDSETPTVYAPAGGRTAHRDVLGERGPEAPASTLFEARALVATPRAAPRLSPQRSTVGYDDREGRFLYATPSLAAYMGMTPDELIGRTWSEIGVPPEAVERLEAARRQLSETMAQRQLERQTVEPAHRVENPLTRSVRAPMVLGFGRLEEFGAHHRGGRQR